MKKDELSEDVIIIRVYFFEVFKDLVIDGFIWKGQKYILLTASAGQIRQKKAVFIKESLYKKYEMQIMCGLSIDEINRRGGCNVNKFLAYVALCSSATDLWSDFDIDKSIVVKDMESVVEDVVDFMDDKTWKCIRKRVQINLDQVDGIGMYLPDTDDPKSFMVRLPWIKGLLTPFPFDKFILEHEESENKSFRVVKDIYGKEHDVIAEGIRYIFTESQFKMWKYYDNWEQYKEYFVKYKCMAGICNLEDDVIGNATINYQMLQTLSDVTDDELSLLASKTNYNLRNISSSVPVMLRALGAVAMNEDMDYKQKCLLMYPELLQDLYFRRDLRQMKDSMERNAWAGKLEMYAKYLFIIPDMYAMCEWLFLGEENPTGLLPKDTVYAQLFETSPKLDCLRSPHLYREHAVRENIAFTQDLSKWFSKRGLYVSCHDFISRILQNDFDGDKSLVVADKNEIAIAERTMKDVVPLYYDMAKAKPVQINNASLYEGMTNAYIMGNIGPISNDITKIWNSENPNVDTVKLLCMKNNFVIDAAKTLYTPIPPADVAHDIRVAVKGKTPWFFQWAKGKDIDNVEPYTPTTVNRLCKIVPHRKMRFKKGNMQPFDYKMLMHNKMLVDTPDVERIIDKYRNIVKNMRMKNDDDASVNNYSYLFQGIREEMLSEDSNDSYIVDAIIYGIFKKYATENKSIFWEAFGDFAYNNLCENIKAVEETHILCPTCMRRYPIEGNETSCPYCGAKKVNVYPIVCEDCGETFYVQNNIKNKTRCHACQEMYRKHYQVITNRNNRAKKRLMTG